MRITTLSWIEFTEYAIFKIGKRDILEEEVAQALEASRSKHKNHPDGRAEVVERIGNRRLKVVYLRLGEKRRVINAMWET